MSRARRPDVVVVSAGTVTAAQHLTARQRPHTIRVNIADTSAMIADSGRLQRKHDIMYSMTSEPTIRPTSTAISH